MEFGLDLTEAADDQTVPTNGRAPEPSTTIRVTGVLEQKPGGRIGRYKLLEQIGEGGGGVVYVAEQQEPVKRRVALKVIKLGMDTRQVVARFEAERQALALMDHLNIAKVLDAGATDTGRPYFVMELVRGIRITDYCDQNNLSTPERLKLFTQVCNAIQHAHQKGIIHRDIKPSNILVTLHDGVPVPKMIDFGIAKATAGQTLTDKTVYTAFEQFIGTPAYMSPEQAEMSGLDIDTRSDIYSLGVLLYELLTGKTPFDQETLIRAGLMEMRRIIREQEPPRPSTRLSTLAAEDQTSTAKRRQTDPPRLIHLVRGDLDWIVMKCLEKDRTRRYDTANGLALDIERHLGNEPIVARPPSNLYRFQKLVRRNKLAFAAATAVVVALVAGIAASAWWAVRATELREDAQKAQSREAEQRAVAEQRLYDSLLSAARATRVARGVGYRNEVFALLKQASALKVPQKDVTELRREAVACLGDFVGLAPATLTDFPTNVTISLVRFDPAGQVAAFALSDGSILLRRIPSGLEVAHFRPDGVHPPRQSESMCFNVTGDQLFAVRLPDLGTEEEQVLAARLHVWNRETDGHWDAAQTLAIPGAVELLTSAKGIFVTALDSKLRSGKLIDVKTKAVVHHFDPAGRVSRAALSPDGRLFAVEAAGAAPLKSPHVDLWDLDNGERLASFGSVFGSIRSLGFSADSAYFACFSGGGGAVYSMDRFQPIATFRECFQWTSQLSLAPNSPILGLPIVQQNSVRLWDYISNRDFAVLKEVGQPFETAFAPDGGFLLTYGGKQSRARLYQLCIKQEKLALPRLEGGVPGIAFSPDGTRLASGGPGGIVRLWDAVAGRKVREFATSDSVQTVTFSRDGQYLVAGAHEGGKAWVWEAHSGNRVLELGATTPGDTWSTEFSPDGRYLVVAGRYGVNVWQLEQRGGSNSVTSLDAKLVKSVANPTWNLVFAPDGQHVAFTDERSSSLDGVSLWKVGWGSTPRHLPTSRISVAALQSLSFTPDSHRLLVLDRKRRVVTFNIGTGEEASSFSTVDPKRTPEWVLPGMCLSSKGIRLAMTSASGCGVDVWDSATGHLLFSFPEQTGTVWWLAWSPDSQRLAVSRSNGDIEIWNLQEAERVLTELGLSEPVSTPPTNR